jgi:Transposase
MQGSKSSVFPKSLHHIWCFQSGYIHYGLRCFTRLATSQRPTNLYHWGGHNCARLAVAHLGLFKFLDEWCRQTMRSRIEPMKKIARSLRQHRELILNYFRAQKLISSGVVAGLNNKAKVTMRKSYGFRTYRVLELALYHSLGELPEPVSTHDFF